MNLNDSDIQNIEEAIAAGGDIWANPLLGEVKRKIKDRLRVHQGEQCCYCKKNIHGEFRFVLDIEHVLPKSKFKQHMFSIKNLGVACKRCNMDIKREDISFFTGINNDESTHFVSESYLILHPHLDCYFDHMKRIEQTVNDSVFVKYAVQNDSAKGRYTYKYFRFSELEKNSVQEAQGGEATPEISGLIASDTADRIRNLLKK